MEDKVTTIREFEIKTPSSLEESHLNTMILALKNVEILIDRDDTHIFDIDAFNCNLDIIIDTANKMKYKI